MNNVAFQLLHCKKQDQKNHVMYRKIFYSILWLFSVMSAFAQSPDMYPPTVPETVDVNLFNIILYIVLPIGLVAAFFWYQRSQKKKKQKRMEEREKDAGKD